MLFIRILRHLAVVSFVYFLFLAYVTYKPYSVPVNEWKEAKPPYPSNTDDNIFWFVQVSDIHISKFIDPKRVPDFTSFCSQTLDVIQPKLVLVTGDLTDAKMRNRVGSTQYKVEWETYNKILRDTDVTNRFLWLDVRGNHDTFDVQSKDSLNNYYKKYSGDKGKLTTKPYDLILPFGNYSFIPVDATMTPGPKRPFNFIGHLDRARLQQLQLEGESRKSSNLTVWYSHYPISSINSASPPSLENIVGQTGDLYLSGHFHDFRGLAPHQYAMHSQGFLELEVADWMNNRRFRIVSVDHDITSFTDATHGQWPIVVITNPKQSTFMIPKHEPIGRIAKSSHIRFLIFDHSDITHVSLSIDGKLLDEKPQNIKGPLWACRWYPDQYESGNHILRIHVQDKLGNTKDVSSQFTMDTSWSNIHDVASILVLLTNFSSLCQVAFVLAAVFVLSVLIVIKQYGAPLPLPSGSSWPFKLRVLLSDNFTFAVLFLFILNLLIGPMFIGNLLTDKVGVAFVYGLLIDGHIYSEHMLYLYGFITIVLFFTPVVAYLCHCADLKLNRNCTFIETLYSCNRTTLANILFLLHTMLQVLWCRDLYNAYGQTALLLSPARLWWCVASVGLAVRIWCSKSKIPKRQT
uniref:transmembrane protein 62 n=1 Tax=Ciona intestinalis TaxID=7719 RepID=UPI000180BB22|nr:transmembrane protein 62 [Ciona intestinalis]|eukprot:XP_002129413.1 transmembrane protein 62 [Ciona intestinalis]